MSVRAMNGSASSSSVWPTPDAHLMNDGETPQSFEARRQRNLAKGVNGNGQGTPLGMAVQMWPTAAAQDSESTSGSDPQWGHGSTLTDASRSWATPTSRDHKGAPEELIRPDGKIRLDQLDRQAESHSHRVQSIHDGRELSPTDRILRRRLNPVFVCWLMGWPTWWTNVGPTACAQSEMASYLSRLRWLCDACCDTSAIEAAA